MGSFIMTSFNSGRFWGFPLCTGIRIDLTRGFQLGRGLDFDKAFIDSDVDILVFFESLPCYMTQWSCHVR